MTIDGRKMRRPLAAMTDELHLEQLALRPGGLGAAAMCAAQLSGWSSGAALQADALGEAPRFAGALLSERPPRRPSEPGPH